MTQFDIKLDETLYAQMDAVAQELGVSHSEVIALAIQAFIKRREAKRIKAALDAVYAEPPTEEEAATLRAMKAYHQELMTEEQW